MEIEVEADTSLPDSLIIWSSGDSTIFYDNGTGADSEADDYIYSAYIAEDTAAFRAEVTQINDSLAARGSYIYFNGHDGKRVCGDDVQQFDLDGFFAGTETWVPGPPFTIPIGIRCSGDLLRENSLFITDLNVVGSSTPPSNLSFGTLMQNMANCTGTNCTREFIKQWLKSWTSTQHINSQDVGIRSDIIAYVIGPWLGYCGSETAPSVNMTNWEGLWDGTSEAAILANAPFKLTAIVNRIDLRGSSAFIPRAGQAINAGETRFIFSLISPCNIQNSASCNFTIQYYPPKQPNDAYITPNSDFVDWQGMNVIFEFGNTQKNLCELRDFARDWIALSGLTRGGTDYMTALAAITNTVTAANAATHKPNGSAIDRVRTNERILFSPATDFKNYISYTNYNGLPTDDMNGPGHQWEESDWEFRQFEIDPSTHYLKQLLPIHR